MAKEGKKKKPMLQLMGVSQDKGEKFKREVRNLNEVRESGQYKVVGWSVSEDEGFPPAQYCNCKDCYIEAQLAVTRNSPSNGQADNEVIGQSLTISNKENGTTAMYLRSWSIHDNEGQWSEWLMVAIGDPELITENNSINDTLSTLRQQVENDSERIEMAEASLLASTTVRFHRIEENEATINSGEVDVLKEVVYYKPSKIFVAADSAGAYWDTWQGMDAYMSRGTIHKEKFYICAGQSYTWDGEKLCDVSEKINTLLQAEISRANNAEQYLSRRIDNIQSVEYTGTVINSPDEEDITEVDNALKLKDRPWGDGMGYVILRKNKSLQEQIVEENTIYEVRYDFDLNGEEITMPANCVLKFEGGSLSNGKIVGTGSKIDSIPYHIFKKNFSLSSLWNIDVVFPEWFGAKGDGITDDTDAFILSINRVGGTFGTLKLMPNREYIVTRPIAFWGTKFTIDGSNSIIIKNTDTKSGLDDYQTSLAGTVSIDVNSVFISRAPIQEMCITNLRIRNTGEEGYCFYFPEISKSKIEKVTVTDSTYFFASYDCWEFLFSHIEGYKLKKKFIHLRATGTSITCINCHLDNTPFAQTGELAAAFDFTSIAYVTLIGCAADACANLIRLNDTKANLISCGFEGTKQQALYITNRSIVTISALHCYESWPQKAAPMIEVHNSNIYIQGSGFKILNECYGTKIAAVNSIVKVTNTIIKNDEDLIPVSDWVLQTASGGTIYIDDDERTYYIKDAGVTAVKGILAESQYAVSTANRPIANAKSIGLCVYDDDLKKPIWWTGSKWQDALGNEV